MANANVLIHNPTDADVTVNGNTVSARTSKKLTLSDATTDLYAFVATNGCVASDAVKSYAAFKRRVDAGYQFLMRYYDQESLV